MQYKTTLTDESYLIYNMQGNKNKKKIHFNMSAFPFYFKIMIRTSYIIMLAGNKKRDMRNHACILVFVYPPIGYQIS